TTSTTLVTNHDFAIVADMRVNVIGNFKCESYGTEVEADDPHGRVDCPVKPICDLGTLGCDLAGGENGDNCPFVGKCNNPPMANFRIDYSDTDPDTIPDDFPLATADTHSPVFGALPSRFAEATSAQGAAVSFSVQATDVEDGPVPVLCLPTSQALFPIGVTNVSCVAADRASHATTAAFSVTVTDVRVVGPDDITVEATSSTGADVPIDAPAVRTYVDTTNLPDQCGGAVPPKVGQTLPTVPVTCTGSTVGSFVPGTITFPVGTTDVTCSATDSHGTVVSDSFTVTVHGD